MVRVLSAAARAMGADFNSWPARDATVLGYRPRWGNGCIRPPDQSNVSAAVGSEFHQAGNVGTCHRVKVHDKLMPLHVYLVSSPIRRLSKIALVAPPPQLGKIDGTAAGRWPLTEPKGRGAKRMVHAGLIN